MNFTKSQKGTLGAMIALALLGIVIAVIMALNYFQDKAFMDLITEGTQTDAEVVGCDTVRDSEGDVSGYKVYYKYTDAETSIEYEGETRGTIGYEIDEGDSISIYYIGSKSVQASFQGGSLLLIFLPAAAALVGVVGIIVVCLQGRSRGLIMKHGHDGEATFVSYEVGRTYQPTRTYTNSRGGRVTVPTGPAVNYYKIRYLWNADNGRQVEGVSSSDYSLEEAQRFKSAAKFNIRSYAGKSMVMGVPDAPEVVEVAGVGNTDSKAKFCEYCGAELDEGNTCIGCGKQY